MGWWRPVSFPAFPCLFITTAAMAQERLPTIPPDQYRAEQKAAAEEFLAARKVPVFGPFEPLMYSPDVMSQARAMGDYLRYKSRIGTTLSELVILVTAREWTQDYEWYVHAPSIRAHHKAAGAEKRGPTARVEMSVRRLAARVAATAPRRA